MRISVWSSGVCSSDLQIEAARAAHDLDVVKIGMLGTPATIEVVAEGLRRQSWRHVVLDPVLICKGQAPGAALDTDTALRDSILPLAKLVTPTIGSASCRARVCTYVYISLVAV